MSYKRYEGEERKAAIEELRAGMELIQERLKKPEQLSLFNFFREELDMQYPHAQAMVELGILSKEEDKDDARLNWYGWEAGNPTFQMAEDVWEVARNHQAELRERKKQAREEKLREQKETEQKKFREKQEKAEQAKDELRAKRLRNSYERLKVAELQLNEAKKTTNRSQINAAEAAYQKVKAAFMGKIEEGDLPYYYDDSLEGMKVRIGIAEKELAEARKSGNAAQLMDADDAMGRVKILYDYALAKESAARTEEAVAEKFGDLVEDYDVVAEAIERPQPKVNDHITFHPGEYTTRSSADLNRHSKEWTEQEMDAAKARVDKLQGKELNLRMIDAAFRILGYSFDLETVRKIAWAVRYVDLTGSKANLQEIVEYKNSRNR